VANSNENGNFDSALKRNVNIAIEVLANVTYLASEYAEDPDEVRKYMAIAKKRVSELVRLMNDPMNTKNFAS
jgi:ribonuclease PH